MFSTAREAALGAFPDKVYRRGIAGRPSKISKSTKTDPKTCPQKEAVVDQFWSPFGPEMDPKIGPKWFQKLSILVSISGSLFFEVLELLGCLLGAFLGLASIDYVLCFTTVLELSLSQKEATVVPGFDPKTASKWMPKVI